MMKCSHAHVHCTCSVNVSDICGIALRLHVCRFSDSLTTSDACSMRAVHPIGKMHRDKYAVVSHCVCCGAGMAIPCLCYTTVLCSMKKVTG